MGIIKLNKDFTDIDGKVMNAERECCVILDSGKFAHNSDGSLLTRSVPTPDEILTLKKVCVQALLADFAQEQIPSDEKYEKYKVFEKFHNANGKIELDAKEVVLVKKWVGKSWGTLVMGQAYDMLEDK